MKYKNIYSMKQPELGKKILELRKQKGFTQEELVAQCNINVRTIQRIEAGEVTPRSYTVRSILEVLEIEESDDFFKEKKVNKFSFTEKKQLNISWVLGILVAVLSIASITQEFYLQSLSLNNKFHFINRVIFSILFFSCLFYFLKGYKIVAKKHKIYFLKKAVNIYLIVTVIMSIISVLSTFFDKVNVTRIGLGVVLVLLLGVGEMILGIGVLKLKEIYGSFPLVVGVLKIINGAFLLTFILSPVAMILAIPILILEVVLIYNILNKDKPNQI